MQLDATIFQKKINIFFGHKKLKKPASNVAQKYSIFFSPIAAKTAQTKEFMFQNVAYRPTVYKTGVQSMKIEE